MKGLVLKDLLNLRGYSKNFIVFIGLGILYLYSFQNSSFITGMIMLLSIFLVITTMSYDDMAHWDKFALSMPITRKMLVGAKYLVALALAGIGAAISALLIFIFHFIKPGIDLVEGFATIGILICVGLFFVGILLPLVFKFGAEKARITLMLVVALPMVIFSIAATLVGKLGITPPSEAVLNTLVVFGIPIAAILVFIVSYFISKGIMAKKEL